jgi:hypothetical protein
LSAGDNFKARVRAVVECAYARRWQSIDRYFPGKAKSENLPDSLETGVALFVVGSACLLDSILGPWILRQGILHFVGLFVAAYLVGWAFRRWVNADTSIAPTLDLANVSRQVRITSLVFSIWVTLLVGVGGLALSTVLRDRAFVHELVPVYIALREGREVDAATLLAPMLKEKHPRPEPLALQALLALRGHEFDTAHDYAEAAVWEQRTSFSKACGMHTKWIDRRDCHAFLDQLTIHDRVLSDELHERYCHKFAGEFPTPDAFEGETSGCGVPAPMEW